MTANSHSDGIIKTTGIIGQAGRQAEEQKTKTEGERFIYVWAATIQLHSLNIYRALLEAWFCVKGWLRPRPCFGKVKYTAGRGACRWISYPNVW